MVGRQLQKLLYDCFLGELMMLSIDEQLSFRLLLFIINPLLLLFLISKCKILLVKVFLSLLCDKISSLVIVLEYLLSNVYL